MKNKKKIDEDMNNSAECNNPDCTCNPCSCGDDCHCHEGQDECECNNGKQCNCHCEDECHCTEENHCGCQDEHECECDDCNCNEDEKCEDDCNCTKSKVEIENKNYLNDLLRLQAEFDNYRKRMQTALGDARKDGFIEAIDGFLPALDSFKMATDMITDQNTLTGIKFIEKGILDTLSKIGVDEIDTSGKFNPDYHQAIFLDENAVGESGDIVNVASKGYTYKGKVIRYAQVIVKK